MLPVRAVDGALLLYVLVTALFTVRLVNQLTHLRVLQREAKGEELCPNDAAFFRRACAHFGVSREVYVASSAAASTPFTFGLHHPVLVLPIGFTLQVSQQQLHAALSHEAAHVARHDSAKHLAYRLFSLLIAFHPVTWLTLARLVNTREQVCDSLAASLVGGPRTYARTLLELSSLLASARLAPPNAVGIFDGRHLERRIIMLQYPLPDISRTRSILSIACASIVCISACTSALALHRHLDAPAETRLPSKAQPAQVPPGVMAGQIEHKVQPVYPAEAKKAHIAGAVVLKAVISKNGTIGDLSVLSGPQELQQSAFEAVRQWVYRPYLLNGEPTEVETNITITYTLGDSAEQHAALPAPASANDTSDWVAPKILSQVNPVYPPAARRAKIGGEVIVGMKVGTDGTVSEVAALSGPEELRGAATDAARQYVFAPATRNGQPMPIEMKVSIKFEVF